MSLEKNKKRDGVGKSTMMPQIYRSVTNKVNVFSWNLHFSTKTPFELSELILLALDTNHLVVCLQEVNTVTLQNLRKLLATRKGDGVAIFAHSTDRLLALGNSAIPASLKRQRNVIVTLSEEIRAIRLIEYDQLKERGVSGAAKKFTYPPVFVEMELKSGGCPTRTPISSTPNQEECSTPVGGGCPTRTPDQKECSTPVRVGHPPPPLIFDDLISSIRKAKRERCDDIKFSRTERFVVGTFHFPGSGNSRTRERISVEFTYLQHILRLLMVQHQPPPLFAVAIGDTNFQQLSNKSRSELVASFEQTKEVDFHTQHLAPAQATTQKSLSSVHSSIEPADRAFLVQRRFDQKYFSKKMQKKRGKEEGGEKVVLADDTEDDLTPKTQFLKSACSVIPLVKHKTGAKRWAFSDHAPISTPIAWVVNPTDEELRGGAPHTPSCGVGLDPV